MLLEKILLLNEIMPCIIESNPMYEKTTDVEKTENVCEIIGFCLMSTG